MTQNIYDPLHIMITIKTQPIRGHAMQSLSHNSLNTQTELTVKGKAYTIYSLPKAYAALGHDLSRLPFSIKVLLENLLRYEDGKSVSVDDIKAFVEWYKNASPVLSHQL